jgi:hypothetical protein
MFLGMSFVAH